MNNRDEVLDRFGRQADRFERRGASVASRQNLRWAASFLELSPRSLALDVAGGTGLMARTVSPLVKTVIVLDLTPAMLTQGRAAAESEGLRNVRFLRGEAEHLPFPGASFDITMTRFSLHHIPRPQEVVAEMARVTRPAGQVVVIDLVAPDAPELARSYNRLEKLRDPSHTRALSRAELERLMAVDGLKLLRSGSLDTEVELENWLELAATPPVAAEQIRQALHQELHGGPPTGMRPVLREALMYTQTAVTLVACRP